MGEKAKDHCHVVYFSRLEKPVGGVYVEDGDIILEDGDKKINVLAIKDLKLMGAHNVENVLAAVGISYYTVSYTHLDVYKRQWQHSLTRMQATAQDLIP